MIIKSAQFVKGLVPGPVTWDESVPQIVLYGRSNAGKSSTINALTNRNALARESKTPGRTREANLMLINDAFYLVDLPGYGYAAASKSAADGIKKLIRWFTFDTKPLSRKCVLILDSKLGLTDLDREMLEDLKHNDESIVILLNKIDRSTQSEVAKARNAVSKEAGPEIPVIPFSAQKRKGIEAFWKCVEEE